MKRFYSLLMLTFIAALSFVAKATSVTVELSNVNAVSSITYNYGDDSITPAKTFTWDTSTMPGSLTINFKDDCSLVSIVNKTTGYEFGNNDYYYSEYGNNVSLYVGDFENHMSDGDVILVTTLGGESSGGGDEAVPADKVRFKFTNPTGIVLYEGYVSGDEVPMTGADYVDWDPSWGNLAASLPDVTAVTSIVDETNGYTLVGDYADYAVLPYNNSLTIYINEIVPGNVQLGDVVVINNGEGSGGGTTTPTFKWTYSIFSTDDSITDDVTVTSSDLRIEAKDGCWYVYANEDDLSSTFTISGDVIRCININGTDYTEESGSYTYTVADYQEDTSFIVELKQPQKTYTINCIADIFTFTSDSPDFSYTYADGAYTINGYGNFVQGDMTNEYQSVYDISSITASNGNNVYVGNSKVIYISPYAYPTGTVFTVNLSKLPVTYTFNCAEDVLDWTADPESGLTVSYANGAYTVKNSDLQALSASVKPSLQNKWTIESVTYAGGTDPLYSNPSGFSVPLYMFPTATTFTVALTEIGGGEGPGGEGDSTITIVVTDQNYISASVDGTSLTFADNKASWDLANGTNLLLKTVNGATVSSVTTDAVNSNGYAVSISTSERLPSSNVTAYLSEVTGGSTVTVSMNIPQGMVYTFQGPEGLKIMYNGVQASYADGVYTVSNLNSTQLWYHVQITVEEAYTNQLELVSVTLDGEVVGTPVNGMIEIESYKYNATTHFVVNAQAPSVPAETVTFTAELMNGMGYQANIYVGNAAYDFYDNPRSITVEAENDEIFITSGYGVGQLYKVTVDGKDIPSDMWLDSSTYNVEGFTIVPGSEYYPTDGGRIEIYVTAPTKTEYNVSFNFVNEGTEDFIRDLMVGNLYYRDEEFANAIADGLKLEAGTDISLTFNTQDYTVNTAKVNGNTIDTSEKYSVALSEDLSFEFDVTKTGGNVITVTSEGWQHILVTDPDRNSYTLTGVSTVLELSSTVERLFFNPASGWVIPEGGVEAIDANGTSTEFNAGDGIFVTEYESVNITVIQDGEGPTGLTFTFNCEADVIDFAGGTAGMGNPDRSEVTVSATFANGVYTVTEVPAYLTLSVKESARAEYVLENVVTPQGPLMSYDGVTAEFATSRFADGSEFTINFVNEVEPQLITINVDNPTCISRIYSENSGNITSFPAQYDLNNGLSLTIEAANNCQIDNITINGVQYQASYPAATLELNLTDVEEGAVVNISASSQAAEYTYTFKGSEGIKITYRAIDATYADGVYTLNNITSSNDYGITLQVAQGYENNVVLVSVSDGVTTWTPSGASGVINIPGAEMPKADTEFTLNTRVPAASETVRTVYLTIDDVSAVSRGLYLGNSGYFGFNADGSVALTIKPSEYEIRVVTTSSITAIETDVEGTFTLPTLPSTDITLNLLNAVEGQTINLFTEAITLREDPAVVVNSETGTATVTVNYVVSKSLVGQTLTVFVGETENSTFIPSETNGSFEVVISDLKEGENTFAITVKSARAEDTVEAKATLSGIDAIFMDENGGEVDVYNLSGIKMKPGRIQPGFYIVNGKKVLVK